jgi:hypothetical protein
MPVVNVQGVGNGMRGLVVSTLLFGWFCCAAASEAQPAGHVTQRQINDFAASLERCRRTVVVAPGLRNPGETLPAYISRVAARLPREDSSSYHVRVKSYIDALAAAADSTASARVMPALKDVGAANSSLWRRAARDLSYLPKRMVQVRTAARAVFTNPAGAAPQALASEMLTTLQLVLDAYSNLRDARP